MKKLIMIITVALLAVACNKNQSAVKKLDGQWNATRMLVSEDGKSVDIIALGGTAKFTFNACKLADNDYCDMSATTTVAGSTSTENSVFKVTEKGSKLIQAENANSSSTTTMDILELTRKVAKLKYTDEDGTTEIDLEKI